jgi:ribosome biogenesis GTPase
LDGQRAVVGDDVEIGLAADGRTWKLSRILPRRTKLSRPDVGNSNVERVIVANVDVVAIVVSVVSPPLHPRLIDRYLIAIQRGGARAILLVNKIDLLEHKEDLGLLDPYRQLLPVYVCSCETGEGIQLIRDVLRDSVTAFVGHSGVGKSSVMNALYPELDRDTGDVMRGYGRGAHTTTASQLFDVAGGTRLIDTPGIRSFGLWKMEPGELKWYFPEFEGIQCRFNDCSHSHEPGCGVRNAVDAGDVHAARFDTYLRLLAGE